MKTLFKAACVLSGALILSGPSFADVHNGSVHANGSSTGTVTKVNYGEGNKITSVVFKEKGTDGKEWTIDNNGDRLGFNDIDELGATLEKGFLGNLEVTLKVDMGNLTDVSLSRPPAAKLAVAQPVGLLR